MKISANFDSQQAEKIILDAMSKSLASAIKKASTSTKKELINVIRLALSAAPEYGSLLTGQLRAELGVVNAAAALDQLISSIASGILITDLGTTLNSNAVEGGIRLEILKADYSELYSVPNSSFTSEGGYKIDWLQWLTLSGKSVLVSDHRFSMQYPERSRTGTGIMIKPGRWSVPENFSGTPDDNWIIRALNKAINDIGVILVEGIRKAMI